MTRPDIAGLREACAEHDGPTLWQDVPALLDYVEQLEAQYTAAKDAYQTELDRGLESIRVGRKYRDAVRNTLPSLLAELRRLERGGCHVYWPSPRKD